MRLDEVILTSDNYIDSEEELYVVFAKKNGQIFEPNSESKILKIPVEDLENLDLTEITLTHCPGFEYFLENFVLQDFVNDIATSEKFENIDKKIQRVIYYAENNA